MLRDSRKPTPEIGFEVMGLTAALVERYGHHTCDCALIVPSLEQACKAIQHELGLSDQQMARLQAQFLFERHLSCLRPAASLFYAVALGAITAPPSVEGEAWHRSIALVVLRKLVELDAEFHFTVPGEDPKGSPPHRHPGAAV